MEAVITDMETARSQTIARERVAMIKAKGYRDFTVPEDKVGTMALGIRGEIAAAKAMQRQWNGFDFDRRKEGDVGLLEIRCTAYPNGNLCVRPRDADDRAYVLVRAERHPIYEIVGWMWGHEAKRPEWERDKGHHISSYYLVPNECLHPMEELPSAVR